MWSYVYVIGPNPTVIFMENEIYVSLSCRGGFVSKSFENQVDLSSSGPAAVFSISDFSHRAANWTEFVLLTFISYCPILFG